MKSRLSRPSVFVLMSILGVIWAGSALSTRAQQHLPLTNSSVVKLVRAGFKEKTVIAIIRSRTNRFNLEPERLIDLKRNGVSENIILAMLAQNDADFFADDLGSDSFFGSARPKGTGTENETDIFGSSSGASGETRTRGGGGTSGGDKITTGTATVRILRPPSEAGGAELKLEKTPTLTNETIISLVDAGFSEGTIIKRIETSPSDFDLSPAKLAELRRRRVTDSIIAAMTSAMDGSESKPSSPGSEK